MTPLPDLNGRVSAGWSDPFKTPSVWVPPFSLVAILVLSPTGMTASRCPACHPRRSPMWIASSAITGLLRWRPLTER
jgi:hypothetical protein